MIISDGKLTFDTKIDEKGFDNGIQDLNKALESVTTATNNLSKSLTDAFKADPKKTTETINKVGKESEKAANSAKNLREELNRPTGNIDNGMAHQAEQISNAMNKVNESVSSTSNVFDNAEEPAGLFTNTINLIKQTLSDVPNFFKRFRQSADTEMSGAADAVSRSTVTIQDRVDACKEHLKSLEGQGLSFGDADYDKAYAELSGLEAELKQYKRNLISVPPAQESVNSSISGLGTAGRVAISGLKRLGSVIGSIVKKLGQLTLNALQASGKLFSMLNPLRGIKSASDSCSNSISKFTNRILRMAKTAFVFYILRSGFNSLRQYLGSLLSTNAQLMASMAQIKGNLLTAFQPIYEACLPAINALASALATVCGYLAQFVSLLFGKSVKTSQAAASAQYQQVQALEATGKATDKNAKADKKAAEAKQKLNEASIDQLNILDASDKSGSADSGDTGNDGAGSGGGGTIVPNFTTDISESQGIGDFVKELKEAWNKADFTEIGELIGSKITDALERIPWGGIQEQANKIASCIVTFLNGAMYGTDWTVVGTTIGEAANTIIGFFKTAVEKFDWKALGTSIYTTINSVIKTVKWNDLGKLVSGYANGIFKTIKTAAEGIKWDSIGKKLGKGLQTMISSFDWDTANKAVKSGIEGIATAITNLAKQINWTQLGKNIGDNINNIFKTLTGKKFIGAITTMLNSIIDTIAGAVGTIDWKEVGTNFANAVNKLIRDTDWVKAFTTVVDIATGLLQGITSAIQNIDWTLLIKTLTKCLEETDWSKVAESIFGLLKAAIYALNDILIELGKWIATKIWNGLKDGVTYAFSKDSWSKDAFKGRWNNVKDFTEFWFGFGSEDFEEAGEDCAKGFQNGIASDEIWTGVNSKMKVNTTNVIDDFKNNLGVHSPSVIFKEIGRNVIQGFINGIDSLFSSVTSTLSNLCKTAVKAPFDTIPKWFSDKSSDALEKLKSGFKESPIKAHFSGVWTTIKGCFSGVADWFKTTFTTAWTNVKNVFSSGGKVFTGIKEGIEGTFKTVVNMLIDGINAIVTKPFNAINGMLNRIRSVQILDFQPFAGLWGENPISAPQIPHLATGTVVPANYGQFMAVLGDNKRETEVVSPLSTIEKALENVMNRMGGNTNGRQSITVQCVLDGNIIYETVVRQNTSNTRRTGRNALAEG